MTDEDIRQRIAYLVTHGGLYPQRATPWWVWLMVALQGAGLLWQMLH